MQITSNLCVRIKTIRDLPGLQKQVRDLAITMANSGLVPEEYVSLLYDIDNAETEKQRNAIASFMKQSIEMILAANVIQRIKEN